jgi:hypothetical protein
MQGMWRDRDSPGAALSLRPRAGDGAPGHAPGRPAPLPVPGGSPGAWADVALGVALGWPSP